ncbi:MAG: FlgD immunoglobulin-like domain containing protein [Bacteroidota bacterium]
MKKILPLLFFIALLRAAEVPRPNGGQSLQKSSIREWKFFDVNSIYCTINSAGPYADYLRTNSSGLYWPKGTINTAVYTSGLWIVGKHRESGAIRTATQYYRNEFQPGPISGVYNTSTNDLSVASDPQDSRFRIYKITKGDNSSNNIDYAEWPGDLGAPYNDVNNNGQWDKGIDTPKLTGDQTLWCVYNDLDTALHRLVGTTLPMGVEVHAMYYGFNSPGPLGNTMFIQWKIINKSNAYYDSLFLGLFSDLELGDANDDINGYDTTLHLAYVFNADDNDAGSSGYGTKPPACGTVFLGGNPDLKPYAHPMYLKSYYPYNDAPQGNPAFPNHVYNFLLGKNSFGGDNVNPMTNLPDRFAFSGDPITNTGWTFLASGFMPRDVRSLLSIGPVTLSPGDTQSVDAAFVIAQGSNRLESLNRLREYSATLRSFYANDFSGPAATIQSMVRKDSVSLAVSIHTATMEFDTVSIDVVSEQTDEVIASTVLSDNGMNEDARAYDGIFSGTITLPASPIPVRLNAVVTDKNNKKTELNNLSSKVPLSQVRVTQPVIYSDDLNADGKINPGENVRYGVTLDNPHTFSFGTIIISSLDEGVTNYYSAKKVIINTLLGQSSTSIPYNDANYSNTYLAFSLPSDYDGKHYTAHLLIVDSMNNRWIDSVTFPVEKFTKRISVASHISGRSSFAFDVVVTDPKSIRNHLYVLRGIDTGQVNYGFQIKDSTESRIVLPLFTITDYNGTYNDNHLIPVTDGFKINITDGLNYPDVKRSFSPHQSIQWFTPRYIYIPNAWSKPRSTVHFGDVPSIILKFSKIAGFTDLNSNGIFSDNEPYTFDLSNAARIQKAFLYIQNSSFAGFVDIPFAVFDVTKNPPVKLTVVLHRPTFSTFENRWLPIYDRIYVMSAEYNGNGVIYDSTKGGINLLPQFTESGQLPYYYNFDIITNSEPMQDTLDLELNYNPGLSSRDVFTFNPTEYLIVSPSVPTIPNLSQNFPNPFNPSTKIHYTVVNQSPTSLTIYNILGQRIKTLVHGERSAGTYEIEWNGRDDNNIPVSSGLYLYRFNSEGMNIVKKMMLIK